MVAAITRAPAISASCTAAQATPPPAPCTSTVRPGPAAAAGLVLLPAAFTVLSGNIGLIANLRHPNLNWINETQAVKQGMSVLLSMLVNWGLALAAGLPYLLLLESRMDGGLYLLLCTAVTALAALLTERWLGRRGVLLFESL